MSGNVLKTIYFLKDDNVDNSNSILLGLEKQRGITLDAYLSIFLYIILLYKIRKLQKIPPMILSPKSHVSVLSA